MERGVKGCWAELEWHCRHAGIMRVFAKGDHYGDPYTYCLGFVVRHRYWFPRLRAWWRKLPVKYGLVEYIGVMEIMNHHEYHAIYETMVHAGWGVLSTRIVDGKSRTIEIHKHEWESHTRRVAPGRE